MALTTQQTKTLLSMMSAFDGRDLSTAETMAWQRASEMGHWTYEEAVPAAQEYYAFETRRMMPGDLTRRIKEIRQDRKMRQNAEEARGAARPLHLQGSYINSDMQPGEVNSPELDRLHVVACEVMPDCKGCEAKAGARCFGRTGKLRKIPCLPRTTAARKAGWMPVLQSTCPKCRSKVDLPNVAENFTQEDAHQRPKALFGCSCGHGWIEAR